MRNSSTAKRSASARRYLVRQPFIGLARNIPPVHGSRMKTCLNSGAEGHALVRWSPDRTRYEAAEIAMRVPLAKPACLIALVTIGVMCSRQAEARFVMGIGAASCGKWSEPHTAGALEANYQWVVGFVSGA